MRKISFYPKLAINNIKSNRRLYFPYLLTCIFTVAMFYIVLFIRYNDGLANVMGGRYVESYMTVSYTHLDVYKRQEFTMRKRLDRPAAYDGGWP